ncbi:MAG: hypothetical protein CM15mP120_04470 [Pseudomonadota bacterium]|nr:MAG: hypothetical protein CM15mP120_04470 [Pseudomonadota bacterium]
MGFYLYGELENSDSYYTNAPGVEQSLLQASFDLDLATGAAPVWRYVSRLRRRSECGLEPHYPRLIDDGTYITGAPTPLDTDGDGKISHQEFDVTGDGFTDLNPMRFGLWNRWLNSELATHL